VKARIDTFLDELRPKIHAFLETSDHWMPPETVDDATKAFYDQVKIPMVKGRPSLLFHKLRDNANPNGQILFEGESNRWDLVEFSCWWY
jgi:hypothetical protein